MQSFPLFRELAIGGFILLVLTGVAYGTYFLISLPIRRGERARLFLDLVDTGLSRGQSAERTILGAAESCDPAPGAWFYLLAAYLERGLRLGEALDHVPRLLPPAIAAMLKTGEELGDVGRVMPACRAVVKDNSVKSWSAMHYLPALLVVVLPLGLMTLGFLQVFILPKFVEIMQSMGVEMPRFSLASLYFSGWLWLPVLALVGCVMVGVTLYSFGPLPSAHWGFGVKYALDVVAYRQPWRRNRMHRDFAATLALALDAEVPEERAVTLAAESTANRVIMRRAKQVREALKQGVKLPEAIAKLDDAGEFRWRLTNAAHTPGRFWKALAGWREALDAKAFQQEQAAAQTASSLLILLNGLIVGLVVTSVFTLLIAIIDRSME